MPRSPKISPEGFLALLRDAPLVAFQRTLYGYAIAGAEEAYYAPLSHKGGGNLPEKFGEDLVYAGFQRLTQPRLRTLRPTAKPAMTQQLQVYLAQIIVGDEILDFRSAYERTAGDQDAVIEFETQTVCLAMDEQARPHERTDSLEYPIADMIGECCDLVSDHAISARELTERADAPKAKVKLHLLQASMALQSALKLFLGPI